MFSAKLDLCENFSVKFAKTSWCMTLPTTVAFTLWLVKLYGQKAENAKSAKNAETEKI